VLRQFGFLPAFRSTYMVWVRRRPSSASPPQVLSGYSEKLSVTLGGFGGDIRVWGGNGGTRDRRRVEQNARDRTAA
jgi:hypothetical protein